MDQYLSEIMLFQVSQTEFHLYLGSPDEVRSSMVIIRGKRIASPIRVPPLSKEILRNRYNNTSIDFSQLFPRVRMILILLQIETPKDDLSELFPVNQWEEYQYEQGINSAVPITDEIRNMIEGSSEIELIRSFIQILSDPIRNQRQQALTELVKINTPTSFCLINYLFWIRQELSVSIIRELGRQSISLNFVRHQCVNYVHTADKSYQLFAHAYLLQFSKEILQQSQYYANRQLQLKYYLQYSTKYRITQRIGQLTEAPHEAAESLHLLFDIHDVDDIKFEIRNLIHSLNPKRVSKELLRPAIIDLIQFGETSQQIIYIATGLSLASLFDEITMIDGQLKYISELNKSYIHIRDRILSQIHLWNDHNDVEKIEQLILHYLSVIPPISITEMSEDDLLSKWYEYHPILQFFKSIYLELIKKPVITEIAFHVANSSHTILKKVVENHLDQSMMNNVVLHKHLAIYGTFSDKVNPPETLQQGTVLDKTDLPNIIIDPDFLPIAISTQQLMSDHLFRNIVIDYIIKSSHDLERLKHFIRMVASSQKEKLHAYFVIIEDVIVEKFDYENISNRLRTIIVEILIDWPKITGTFPSETVQNTIDTFKIIFQDDIEDFDLESSKPLAIETITRCYRLTKGQIPKFIESNIQFSFTKPVWDQLARHFLALGLYRPQRSAIAKSKLKEVPAYLTRDVLGQIALVNQTLSYCQRNGFRSSLENLIIDNMYQRGWNVERGLERTLPSLLGSISPRLRSYLAAYLVIEQGEVSLDILQWARDIEDYLLRDRIVRELERYGTPDMWIVVSNSYHPDIQERALEQLKDSRMSASDRSKTIIKMLSSPRKRINQTGIEWMEKYDVQQDDIISLFACRNLEILPKICQYIIDNQQHLTEEHQKPLFDLIHELIWKPGVDRSLRHMCVDLASLLTDKELKDNLRQSCLKLANTPIKSRLIDAISVISKLEV